MATPLDQHLPRYDELIAAFRGSDRPRRPHQVRVLRFTLIGQRNLLRPPEALLLSGEWQMVSGDALVMDAYVVQPRPPVSAYIVGRDNQMAQVFLEETQPDPVEDAFLLGGSTNYAHWLLDSLPRLAMLDAADRALGRPAKIIINTHRALFQSETLAMLGISDDRLLELAYPGVYTARRCFVPNTASGSGTSPLVLQPDAVAWLRAALLPKAASGAMQATPRAIKGGRRLFISRLAEGPGKMRLVNHKAVIDAVSRLGFEVVSLGSMSVAEQIGLFAQASVVAGPHGAGFANMAFASQGALLVELMGPRVAREYGPTQFYARLTSVLSQRYARIIGDPVEPEKIDPRHVSTEQYRIDPDGVVRQLAKLLAS
jgi:capsular polysaccharide biosynthesis protein